MTRILLVEDEESFSDPLSFALRRDGFEVAVVADGDAALTVFASLGADLVLLDLMLPGIDGVEVCRRLRRDSDVPIIMVTAKDSEIDKVVGLEIGADDYITKPYSYRELLARVHAVLRRRPGGAEPAEEETDDGGVLRVGDLELDPARHQASVRGQSLTLPLKEFELLETLMRNCGHVLTRGQLIERVWGADYVGDTKTLDVHVRRLRAKVERDPSEPEAIVTVRGLGYKLNEV